MESDKLKQKIIVLVASLFLTAIVILLYFLDNSLEWGVYKICSCIIVSIWVLFLIPALRGSYLRNKNKSVFEWFLMGFRFGASGNIDPVVFAPYYGVRYYWE